MSATASGHRDRATGRYAARPEPARCEKCGWTLAESLAGGLYCPLERCARYRHVVGVAAGVQAGLVTPAVLGVRTT